MLCLNVEYITFSVDNCVCNINDYDTKMHAMVIPVLVIQTM